jgi:DNA end-binding protein Ku
MSPRANWNGYLRLSRVSCAVALHPATTTSSRIRFNIINKQAGNPVRNLVIDAESASVHPAVPRKRPAVLRGRVRRAS